MSMFTSCYYRQNGYTARQTETGKRLAAVSLKYHSLPADELAATKLDLIDQIVSSKDTSKDEKTVARLFRNAASTLAAPQAAALYGQCLWQLSSQLSGSLTGLVLRSVLGCFGIAESKSMRLLLDKAFDTLQQQPKRKVTADEKAVCDLGQRLLRAAGDNDSASAWMGRVAMQELDPARSHYQQDVGDILSKVALQAGGYVMQDPAIHRAALRAGCQSIIDSERTNRTQKQDASIALSGDRVMASDRDGTNALRGQLTSL